MPIRVRSNGQSLEDYVREAAVFRSKATDLAEVEPAYYTPDSNNGYPPDDIILNGLVLNLPLYKLTGSKFKSLDPYHHSCTVTGATWGLQGRTFDGVSNFISIPNAASLKFGSVDFSVEFWVKLHDKAGSYVGDLIGMCAGGNDRWGFSFTAATNLRIYVNDWAALNCVITNKADLFIHLIFTFNHTDDKVYYWQDGVAKTGVAFVDQTFSPTANLTIGKYTTAQWDFPKCVIGEVRIYNRGFILAEAQHNYRATKWRYA